jgi:hypothetical protein
VRSWWQRHSNHAIAGAGAFALLVAVVAVASGPGGDPAAAPTSAPTTVAPSTTEGRPVETAAPSTSAAPQQPSGSNGDGGGTAEDDVDYRFALPTPEGFETTGADLSEPMHDWFRPPAPALFAADDSSWQTGPWLTITSGNEQTTGIATMFPFTRPAMPYTIGDAEARTGLSIDGIEVTTLRQGATVVEIGARGLDPLATAAVAQAIQVADGGIAVPDAAIPAGLRPRPEIDVATWHYGAWSPDQRANVSFGAPAQDGWIGFAALPQGGAAGVLAAAPFFLGDLRYVVVGAGAGVAGSFDAGGPDPIHHVVWQLADRDYVATATGVGLDELIGYAASVLQSGDPDWRTSMWDDLRDDARDCCQQSPFLPYRPVEVPVAIAEGAEWRTEAAVMQAGSVDWNFTLGGVNGDGFGMRSPVGAPVLRVGSRYGGIGQPAEFPAAAVAIVDRTMVGAVLRLSTTGSQPQTISVTLQPVDDDALQPYLVGAVVLPWLDGGFVAQLIAPDGQTIAVQTDADLP